MTYTVKDGGTATKLQRLGRPIAGKTGTSSYAKSIWFSGFIPQLAVSIGMYKPDDKGNPQTLTSSEDTNLTGGTVPADVYYDFMKVVTENMEVQDFPSRAGVGDDKVPTPTTTFTPLPQTTTQAPTTTAPTTTQAPTTTAPAPTTTQPTKTNGTGKPQPTTTAPEPTITVPLPGPSPTSTKPGNNP
jgi:membrane peptidoglycan carboxypeptidase